MLFPCVRRRRSRSTCNLLRDVQQVRNGASQLNLQARLESHIQLEHIGARKQHAPHLSRMHSFSARLNPKSVKMFCLVLSAKSKGLILRAAAQACSCMGMPQTTRTKSSRKPLMPTRPLHTAQSMAQKAACYCCFPSKKLHAVQVLHAEPCAL